MQKSFWGRAVCSSAAGFECLCGASKQSQKYNSTADLVFQKHRETPNEFPITFQAPGHSGKVETYEELFDLLDAHAGMSCYFPSEEDGKGQHFAVKLGASCFLVNDAKSGDHVCKHEACPYNTKRGGCPIAFSNAMCVNRKAAPSLYRAMEDAALYNHDY